MAASDRCDPGEAGELSPQTVVASGQLGDQWLAGQTDAQREIAERIYRRLQAGDSVDDIKDLIGDLAYTATVDQRRRELEREDGR